MVGQALPGAEQHWSGLTLEAQDAPSPDGLWQAAEAIGWKRLVSWSGLFWGQMSIWNTCPAWSLSSLISTKGGILALPQQVTQNHNEYLITIFIGFQGKKPKKTQ